MEGSVVAACDCGRVRRGVNFQRGMHKEDVVYIYIMEYYSAIKRNDTGSFVETWIDLETVI